MTIVLAVVVGVLSMFVYGIMVAASMLYGQVLAEKKERANALNELLLTKADIMESFRPIAERHQSLVDGLQRVAEDVESLKLKQSMTASLVGKRL